MAGLGKELHGLDGIEDRLHSASRMWTILLILVAALIAIGVIPALRRGFFNTAFGGELIMIAGFAALAGGVYLAFLLLEFLKHL